MGGATLGGPSWDLQLKLPVSDTPYSHVLPVSGLDSFLCPLGRQG